MCSGTSEELALTGEEVEVREAYSEKSSEPTKRRIQSYSNNTYNDDDLEGWQIALGVIFWVIVIICIVICIVACCNGCCKENQVVVVQPAQQNMVPQNG